jgi:beta-lactam-binding protein with PASTA domain
MIAAMLSAVVASAGAQTDVPSGQITVVNGTTNKVNVTAKADDGTEIDLGSGLTLGDDGKPKALPAGTYTITFADAGDGSLVAQYTLPLEVSAVWNVVSGYADPSDQIDPNAIAAIAYLVHDEPLPAATVANSSAAVVTVMPDGMDVARGKLYVLPPNTTTFNLTTPGGSNEPIDLSNAPGSSYSMVVAVGPDDALQTSTVTISDLPQLREDLQGTVPPSSTTTVPDTTTTTVPSTTTTTAPALVPVPDVVGEAEADAAATITDAGLRPGTSDAPSDDVAEGIVISQEPAPGTEVVAGTAVFILVSSGPAPPAIVPVPDVVGQDVAEATKTLEAEGFVVEVDEVGSEDVEAGLVIEANPSAGTEVAEGTTVVLTVSSGPADVIVPDFAGMTTAEAAKAAEDAGLTITFVEDPNKPDPDGVVVTQDPEEGVTAPAGSEVVAQLSPAFDDAWAILVVDSERELTVTGINFRLNTTTLSAVLDTTISQTAPVGQSGAWTANIDISSLDASEYFLEVTGTAADGGAYEQTFKIPAEGETTVATDTADSNTGGFPWWGWLIIGLLIIAAVAIGIKMFGGSGDDGDPSTATQGTPPPPPPPPPPVTDATGAEPTAATSGDAGTDQAAGDTPADDTTLDTDQGESTTT